MQSSTPGKRLLLGSGPPKGRQARHLRTNASFQVHILMSLNGSNNNQLCKAERHVKSHLLQSRLAR